MAGSSTPPSAPSTSGPSSWPKQRSDRCPQRRHAHCPAGADGDWSDSPAIKARLAGGYCLRAPAQGACPYANICEHCPNFRTDASVPAILAAQRVDAEALADDAEARGWISEADRHRGSSPASTPSSPRPRPDEQPRIHAAEQACSRTPAHGEPVTFTARRSTGGIRRATLYRDPALRALVDEHRARRRSEHAHRPRRRHRALHTAVEAIAARVRRHEEQLRQLARQETQARSGPVSPATLTGQHRNPRSLAG